VVDEVADEVERIRGRSFEHPVPVEVVDDDQAREHVLRRLDSFGEREQLQRTQEAYRLLGLLPDDLDILETFLAALRDQAGGFYAPETGSFYLLDDMPAGAVGVLTAHELTHALDDQQFDLDRLLEGVVEDDDRLFAQGAVHEGSATLVMTAYTTRAMLAGKLDLDDVRRYEEEFGQTEALAELPAVLVRQLLGPYMLGAVFLARGDLVSLAMSEFPVEDVDRAFTDGPRSSEQILHPEKYWDDARGDEPIEVAVPDARTVLGRRWRKVAEGVLGEVTLAVMTGAETPTDNETLLFRGGAAWTNAAAEGWGGDRWELWRRGHRSVALLLTAWDSEADAEEFEKSLAGKGFGVRRAGSRVAIVAGGAGRRGDELLDLLAAPVEPAP
jgi:hypothetical protein